MIEKLWKYNAKDRSIESLRNEIRTNSNKEYTEICTNCGQYFEFEKSDINKENQLLALPHVWCPTCGKRIQLHSKYLYLGERKQNLKVRMMSLYGETNRQSQSH